MRIESSSILMQGSSYSSTIRSQSTTVGMSKDNSSTNGMSVSTTASLSSSAYRAYSVSNVEIMGNGVQPGVTQTEGQEGESVADAASNATTATKIGKDTIFNMPDKYTFRLKLLQALLSRLNGGRNVGMRVFDPSKLQQSGAQSYDSSGRGFTSLSQKLSVSMGTSMSLSIGSGVSMGSQAGTGNTIYATRTDTMATSSYVSFAAQGSVTTADGRSINLNLNFNVSQEIVQTSQTTIERAFTDPLVIDFDGDLAQFENETMSFDIDSDGTAEDVHKLSAGSGYLALDKNGNGQVDNGTELFGPQTNEGYAELAQYDEDGNGWIDEADSVFSQLKIWYHDENGESHLEAIADKNIGAIYLGYAATAMDMYADDGIAGKMRQSGFVLLESGESRTMHELDVSV